MGRGYEHPLYVLPFDHRASFETKIFGWNGALDPGQTAHIEAFRPTFCKVLVRYNPGGDADLNRRQAARLKRLSDYLQGVGRTDFWEPLVALGAGMMTREAAVAEMSRKYREFGAIFESARTETKPDAKDTHHATRNDRTWPHGREHGAPAVEAWTPVHGVRHVAQGRAGPGRGEGDRCDVDGRFRGEARKAARDLADGTGGGGRQDHRGHPAAA
jgi:hypothetical protein